MGRSLKLYNFLIGLVLSSLMVACMSPNRPRATQFPEPVGSPVAASPTQPAPTLSAPVEATLLLETAASATQPVSAATIAVETQASPAESLFTNPPESVGALLVENSRLRRRDVTYCTAEGVELKLDIFLPKQPLGVVPLVIYVHGGGWTEGDKRGGEGMLDAPALLEAGFAFASLNYRLAPEYTFPAMIQDIKCAIRFLRAHAGEYRIDPQNFGIYGASAGGHLVNMVGTTSPEAGFDVGEYLEQSSRVQAVVDIYGPADMTTDFSPTFVSLKPTVFPDFDLAAASPITHITSDDPPFLILQGDLDRIVPLAQSQLLYQRLLEAGVTVELVIAVNGDHGFKTSNMQPTRPELTDMIVDFFLTYLGP